VVWGSGKCQTGTPDTKPFDGTSLLSPFELEFSNIHFNKSFYVCSGFDVAFLVTTKRYEGILRRSALRICCLRYCFTPTGCLSLLPGVYPFAVNKYYLLLSVKKGKAIPLQALTGPEGSRKLRLPDFKTIGT
jgi:hypothetical protein